VLHICLYITGIVELFVANELIKIKASYCFMSAMLQVKILYVNISGIMELCVVKLFKRLALAE